MLSHSIECLGIFFMSEFDRLTNELKYDRIKEILDPHNHIGWDADETIINGLNSELFARYILENPNKTHTIITFRHQDWANDLVSEINDYDLYEHHFTAIHPCPNIYYQCNYIVSSSHRKNWPSYGFRAGCKSIEEIEANSEYYLHFKGRKAKEIGATILVDDKPDKVMKGCAENKIHYLNAINLNYEDFLPITEE